MRLRRWLLWGTGGLLGALVLVFVAAWLLLRASLPQLDGRYGTTAISSAVIVERDSLGVPTVSGSERGDLAYATGFLHAQERFFQMDSLRRTGAGELAELVGPKALNFDRLNRVHRFRFRAREAVVRLPADQRRMLEQYSKGVNDGLAALPGRPFEYWLIGATPSPWQPEDCLLAIYAMYLNLQGGTVTNILSRALLRETVPEPMLTFLLPRASHWDAPLDLPRGPSVALPAPPAGNPAWLTSERVAYRAQADWMPIPGSNSWAVGKSHSSYAAAIVANDMHLGLRLPNIWYRLSLVYPGANGHVRRVTGVSLPGTPAIVAGSNGRVAWGFTNQFGDNLDLIELQKDSQDDTRYPVPGGHERARKVVEQIAVNGKPPVDFPVLETRWGPILDVGKRRYAVRWIAHAPNAVDMTLLQMENADDVAAALAVGQSSGIPSQNLIVGDAAGRIGWSVAGRLPRRAQLNDGFPVAAASYRPWSGHLSPHEYPKRMDPRLGRLWSGNNPPLLGSEQEKIGGAFMDMGARASQIRDALLARERFDERALSAIQYGDKAQWAEFWRRVMLESLDAQALSGHPQRAELRQLIEQWNGRAEVEAVGYSLVRDFFWSLYDAWFGPLDARMRDLDAKLSGEFGGVSYRAATSRVPVVMEALARGHAWVPPSFAGWKAFMLDRVDDVIRRNTKNGKSLSQARWGDANRAGIGHPFASLIPGLGAFLSAPPDPLPGDIHMPLVNRYAFGASQRMVVAPGHEESGLFHMPGGQSGHPLSPFFLAGHEAWVKGEPTAFLPGPHRHRLVLEPARTH